jgi:hypothetical protein
VGSRYMLHTGRALQQPIQPLCDRRLHARLVIASTSPISDARPLVGVDADPD